MTKKIYIYLTYAGAVPFIFCAFCLSFGIKEFFLFGSIEKILSVYSLIILSFLAGAHWGQHFKINSSLGGNLAILSNIIAITTWLGFLTLDFKNLTIFFVVQFFVLLLIDWQLFADQLITRQYFTTRCYVSFLVILALIISVVASSQI